MPKEPIYVTRTFLPPREEYYAWLDKAYASHVLTNNGPIHRQLEDALRDRFAVPHLRLMANGTLALQIAIRALGVKGKVITTPYSYVATTSAILLEGCIPVFADIKPDTLCIDPSAIEALIDDETTAILATHVYGIPCDVEAIDAIAKKHGLKVIYDAAHAFDVRYKGRSILGWGDASTLSFHATKLFHTVEGGAVVVHTPNADERVCLLRSFGHLYDDHKTLGMNAKLSEVHAAMGMAVLPYVERIVEQRGFLIQCYDALLGTDVRRPRLTEGTVYNNAYYPVLLADGVTRERVIDAMAVDGIHPRKYFYPSLDTLPYVSSPACTASRSVSDRVMCLPLFFELTSDDVERIAASLKRHIAPVTI